MLHLFDGGSDRPRQGDAVQHFTHQALRDVLRAFHQPAQLRLDAIADAAGIEISRQRTLHQRLEESLRRPPERALRGQALGLFDGAHRFEHLQCALVPAGIVPVRIVLQPFQETPLVARALVTEVARRFLGMQRHRHPLAPRRPRRQIGKIQVGLIGFLRVAAVARRDQFAVDREQAQRLVCRAGHELLEIAGDGGDHACAQCECRRLTRHDSLADVGQQTFEFFGDARHAVQTDDGQRAVGLVQVGDAGMELRNIDRPARRELAQRIRPGAHGLVDLALHP